jgi:hypothetical protein
MPSGIIQLLASGAEDKILTSKPEMNHFKKVYMKHSSFSIFNYEIPVTSQCDFDGLVQLEIPKNGDLLRGVQLKIELPQINISYNNSSNVEITRIKNQYSYKSINQNIYNYNLYNLNTFKDIISYQLNYTEVPTNFQLFQYDSVLNQESYKVVIPKIDLNQFVENSTSPYYFEINPDPLIFSNANVSFEYPNIAAPIVETDFAEFSNKILLYSNRNNKLSATFNIIADLFQKNDTTTLLTSDNIKNIFLKNIKDYIFKNNETAGIDSLLRYIDSIRFVRPIPLYDQTSINNILHGDDKDLIGFPEYNLTYYNTRDLKSVLITTTVVNTLLNSYDSRVIYVLTNDITDNMVKYNGQIYGLYNILKFDYINFTTLNDTYREAEIKSYPLFNYIELFKDINLLNIKITPISDLQITTLNDFSELFSINSITLQLNGEYKIIISLYSGSILYDLNLANRYIYFYYNFSLDYLQIPFCIFKISNYYIQEDSIYIYAKAINYVGTNFTTDLLYLVDNSILLQTNTINSDDNDIKRVDFSDVSLDSINLYQNYILSSSNTNFNLNNTITTELSQKNLFKTNVNSYILQNISDNYAILYNILLTQFKQPYHFVSKYEYAKNLYYEVLLTNNGVGDLSLTGLGASTFTEQDGDGNNTMNQYLLQILTKNFKDLTITNNNFLSIIKNVINTYSSAFQSNWNSINNIIQNSSYMINMNKKMNYLENNKLYVQVQLNADLHIGADLTPIYAYDNGVEVASFNVINNYFINPIDPTSDIYYMNLYLSDTNNTISNIFLLKDTYTFATNGVTNYTASISNIFYADTTYTSNVNIFLNQAFLYNDGSPIHGNYILEDYIINLYDYINIAYNKYLTSKKYTTSKDILQILDMKTLYKYSSYNSHYLFNDVDERTNNLINTIIPAGGTYIRFLSDFEYITDTINLNSYIYDNLISDFYDSGMINGYYSANSFVDVNILNPNIVSSHTSFTKFMSNITNTDTFFKTNEGQLFNGYLYYLYGSQLDKINFSNIGSIRYDDFSYENILTLGNKLKTGTDVDIYDASNVSTYLLNNVRETYFNYKTYQYNMNPHLYYSYLNMGYIENLLSLSIFGNIDLQISNYSNFKYSDIDNVITNVLKFYEGMVDTGRSPDSPYLDYGILVVYMRKGVTVNSSQVGSNYSNIAGYSTIRDNILKYNANIIPFLELNVYLSDLVTYSTYRTTSDFDKSRLQTESRGIIANANIYVQDVKNLIMYFNDYLDNLQYIRYILLNDTTITTTALTTKLEITSYSNLDILGINDYTLEYFISNDVYLALSNYRTTYVYNDVLTGFDNDSKNYYDYMISIADTIKIGSSLKDILDKTTILYPDVDVNSISSTRELYGNVVILDLDQVETYLIGQSQIFTNYYNEYVNNIYVLNLKDDIELNTINNSIKSINLSSNQYIPTLSTMDQFGVYNRKLFGYNVSSNSDIIYDTTASLTYLFTTQGNLANVDTYTVPFLDSYVYDNYYKTYEYQLKRIQSYFFNSVDPATDTDLKYLKPYYALENYDKINYNPVFIMQVNKLYNSEIPSYVSSNITSLPKLDNNFNQLDYNVNRMMSNCMYYMETLKILDYVSTNDTLNTFTYYYNNGPINLELYWFVKLSPIGREDGCLGTRALKRGGQIIEINDNTYRVQSEFGKTWYDRKDLQISSHPYSSFMSYGNVNTMVSYLMNNVIYTDYKRYIDQDIVNSNISPYNILNVSQIKIFMNLPAGLFTPPQLPNIPIINKSIDGYISIPGSATDSSQIILYTYVFYQWNILYLLHDLYLLDGKMRVKYSDIYIYVVGKFPYEGTLYNQQNYATIYRTLVSEYFYLILRGKQVMQESTTSTVKYSDIYNIVQTTKLYDILNEWYLNSLFDTTRYDLFNVSNDYKIPEIQNNHYYSENYMTVFSIKNAINDKNFQHLIDLTNYNNKYSQFYYLNSPTISNITLLKQLYLANINNSNITFLGNIGDLANTSYSNLLVTTLDYDEIYASNLITYGANLYANIWHINSSVPTGYENLPITFNDMKIIKGNIIQYFMNEIKNSNVITNHLYYDFTSNTNIQTIPISNITYNGNVISNVNINLNDNTFNIQGYSGKYYKFDFDYLPKLYNYEVNRANLSIKLNHFYDNNFSNIYDNLFIQYKNLYLDNTYIVTSNINITQYSGYMYFSNFINDLKTLIVNHNFEYNLTLTSSNFNVSNGNILIASNTVTQYTNYISALEKYKLEYSIKDSLGFISDPLQFDTNYIRYTLMNHGANMNNNANIFFNKLPHLIEKTDSIHVNTYNRLYTFNQFVNLVFSASINGSIAYNEVSISNTYIGNIAVPVIKNTADIQLATYNIYTYQQGGDSNVLVLNSVIDINNQKDNLEDEKLRLYDNVLSKIYQTNNDITNYFTVNNLVDQINVRPANAIVSWIEKLGVFFADYYEFYIGGEVIERLEDDFINCLLELCVEPGQYRGLKKMIGQDARLIIKQPSLGKYTLYIDLPFFFNRYKKIHSLSVPIIALLYSKLNLKFKIKKLDDLLVKLPYTTIKRGSKMKMSLLVDYILLDHTERKKFAESKHEYIIEQVQYSIFTTNTSSINKIKFNFKNPTKMMMWFARLKDKVDKKQYYNYTLDDYYIDINKYSALDETSNKYFDLIKTKYPYIINNLVNDEITEQQVLCMPFQNYDQNIQNELINAVIPSQVPIISSSELKVNGHTRFKTSSDETQKVRPYTFFNNSYLNGINVYNFDLYPMTAQPSGSINFSFLNDINLLVNINPSVSQDLNIKTMTVSYNILRIMSGYGGLGFDII